MDAERDIQAGLLIIEDYGFPRKGQDQYTAILRQRYQITVRRVAGDIIDVKAIGHATGYNEVAKTEIKRRFGRDVLHATEVEAAEIYERKRQR